MMISYIIDKAPGIIIFVEKEKILGVLNEFGSMHCEMPRRL